MMAVHLLNLKHSTYKLLHVIVHCRHIGTGERTFLQQCQDTSPSTEVNCYCLVSPFTRESSRCVCAMKLNLARAWPSLGRLGIVRIPSYGIICRNKMLTCWRYEQQYNNLRISYVITHTMNRKNNVQRIIEGNHLWNSHSEDHQEEGRIILKFTLRN